MGKTVKVDFEKARKKRRLAYTAKRFLVLGLIMLAVAGVIVLNNLLVEQGVSVRVNDLIESFGGTGFPTDLPGGIIRDVKNIGKNLAVLNDTNLYIYSPKARIISSTQEMSETTVLLANSERALTFNTGSKRYRIHSSSKLLAEKEAEDSILAASLSNHGEYALVTSPTRFVAMVTVYDRNFEPFFYAYSADNHITGVSVSPKGDMMVTSGVNTEKGMLKSIITFYRFTLKEEVSTLTFEDSLILHLGFYGDDRVAILTDREYIITDSSGKILYSYATGNEPVTAIRLYKGEALILTENREVRISEITLLDDKCAERWRVTASGNIRGIELGQKKAYILDDSGVSVYNRSGDLINRLDMRGISKIYLVGDKLYCFTQSEITVMEEK